MPRNITQLDIESYKLDPNQEWMLLTQFFHDLPLIVDVLFSPIIDDIFDFHLLYGEHQSGFFVLSDHHLSESPFSDFLRIMKYVKW